MGAGLKKLSRPDGERRMQRSVVLHTEVGCEAGEGRELSHPVPAMCFPCGGMGYCGARGGGCVCCPCRLSSHHTARCPLSPEQGRQLIPILAIRRCEM